MRAIQAAALSSVSACVCEMFGVNVESRILLLQGSGLMVDQRPTTSNAFVYDGVLSAIAEAVGRTGGRSEIMR